MEFSWTSIRNQNGIWIPSKYRFSNRIQLQINSKSKGHAALVGNFDFLSKLQLGINKKS